jgi:hypothetical protein
MIRTRGDRFVDEHGRTLLLRGVNLGGSSKVPLRPDGATHRREGFFEHRDVSFVGRPFPVEEADEHFARLASWGLRTIRLLVTWEAIEHEGPRRYDRAYLDYLEALARKAGDHGLSVFVDLHQDVWSRVSGGDGAPGWTLEAAGFALENLHQTGAAFVHCLAGDPLPGMIWPSNAGKLAAATMFTLFFAGDTFAPRRKIDGAGAQRFLQEHFLGAVEQVASRLSGIDCVFGYDVLNEPSAGYIGWQDLRRPRGPVWLGALPSPLESMALGDGASLEVDVWTRDLLGARVTGRQRVNPRRLRAWRDGVECPWLEEGIWEPSAGGPKLRRPDAFSVAGGRPVSFARDFYKPFLRAALARIRAVAPQAVFFVEAEPMQAPPPWSREDGENVAFAPHWYDGVVLFLKRFHRYLGVDARTERPVFLPSRVRESYRRQLELFRQESRDALGGIPVLVGELGIAFDLNGGKAYRTGDFSAQAAAMDRSLTAVEDAGLSATIWNYTADNTHARGDQWNGEDLSIYAREDGGGRALDAVVRPYPMAVAGEIVRCGFERKTRRFELVFRHGEASAPTEIFVPALQYPTGPRVTVSDGRFELDAPAQRLRFFHDSGRAEHVVRLEPALARTPR